MHRTVVESHRKAYQETLRAETERLLAGLCGLGAKRRTR